MKLVIFSGNPKSEGLCRQVTDAVITGAKEGGAQVQEIVVNSMNSCRVCSDGWGICKDSRVCAFGSDGFSEAQNAAKEADAIVFVSPIYWAEVSEGLKSFLDRLRRCENNLLHESGAITGKPVLLIASPGGSGRGALTALEEMERVCEHTGAVVYDRIIMNRWNRDYKCEAARAAARTLAEGRRPGMSVD